MTKELKAVLNEIEKLSCETGNLADTTSVLSILFEQTEERPPVEKIGGTFSTITTQLEAITERLTVASVALMRILNEGKKNESA